MLDEEALEAVRRALAEDLGAGGDLTTAAVVPEGARARAVVSARRDAVLAGTEVFGAVFRALDPGVRIDWAAGDGGAVRSGDVVARIEGRFAAILSGERTALNFLQRLSGIATLTRAYVEAAGGVEVRDTRKTTPGLRSLEKAAVRAGGGTNHRMGLGEGIFLKDNHVAACGGVRPAIERARAARPGLPVLVECETLEQLREAVSSGAEEVLLDNMDVATVEEAVRIVGGRAKVEASGGVTLETIGAVAKTGVDSVSVGALTHSAPAVDLSLEVTPDAPRG
jgi:nicotinate-nucleotide pyrophosphorylase (carboxylating)